MAGLNASERNQLALARLIRDRKIAEAKARKRAAQQVLRDRESSKDQRYRARKNIARAEEEMEANDVVAQASKWKAYRQSFTPGARTRWTAEMFLSGFGTAGASGIPNRRGGFVSTRKQREDRAALTRYIHQQSLYTLDQKIGRVRDFNEDWWSEWREQYADKFL